MSLLTLCPEATRLRRIAKACSAGELSRTEYREARRRVIDKISNAPDIDIDSDDTVPRFDVDVTQERSAAMPDAVAVASQQNRLLWIVFGALLLAGLTLPLWTSAAPVLPVDEQIFTEIYPILDSLNCIKLAEDQLLSD